MIHNFLESRVALNPELGGVRDVVHAIDSIKPSLLFSISGCYISKGPPFQIIYKASNFVCILTESKHCPNFKTIMIVFRHSEVLKEGSASLQN